MQSAGTTQVGLVNSAGQQQAENIAQAGSQQVQAVQTAGNTAVGSVNTARDNALDALEEVAAHTPVPNPDTGKWQVWDAETGQYEDTTVSAEGPHGPQGNPGPAGQDGAPGVTPQLTIGTVTTLEPDEDATVAITGPAEAPVLNFGIPKGEPGEGSTGGSDLPATTAADRGKAPTVNVAGTGYELTGPYAPLSAAIIETAKGNPAVCEDSVEWGLQGMRVYGKSTQDGIPSPENPVPIVSAGNGGEINVKVIGKNLIDTSVEGKIKVDDGVTWTINTDGSVTIEGTAVGGRSILHLFDKDFNLGIKTLHDGTYTLSLGVDSIPDGVSFLIGHYKGSVYAGNLARLSSSTIFPSVIGSSRSLPPSRRGTEQNQQRLGQPLEVIT